MSKPPTVFLIDSDDSLLSIVRSIATAMNVLVEHYPNAENFIGAYRDETPGCVITEFRLMGISGLELQRCLAQSCIKLPLVFVSAYAETQFVVEAMLGGAITVLEKPVSEQLLWEAIRKGLSSDQQFRNVEANRCTMQRKLSKLTEKERVILNHIIQGKTTKAIAVALKVSPRTIENHRQQIYTKTGTTSIVELARLVLLLSCNERSRNCAL